MPASVTPDTPHRRRLLDAMAEAVARKGYADTTIADLAAGARVSRRTFYEHFATKEECLVALYEAASKQALGVLRSAIDPAHDPLTQAEQALRAYLATMASNPALLKTLFIAILGLGAVGLQARRRVNQQLADFILDVVNGPHDGARHPTLPAPLAMSIVGGINELVLQMVEQDRIDQLTDLTATTAQFVRAVVDGSR
ncbi:MAG: TetR/AcrR family transcriptional regulator [Rhizobacter sp.]|nr:TetR/AcrR family transcriptional regulator [Rhizobacter sp.]